MHVKGLHCKLGLEARKVQSPQLATFTSQLDILTEMMFPGNCRAVNRLWPLCEFLMTSVIPVGNWYDKLGLAKEGSWC